MPGLSRISRRSQEKALGDYIAETTKPELPPAPQMPDGVVTWCAVLAHVALLLHLEPSKPGGAEVVHAPTASEPTATGTVLSTRCVRSQSAHQRIDIDVVHGDRTGATRRREEHELASAPRLRS